MPLSQFSEREKRMFSKDFMCIVHICRKLNENLWRVEQGIVHNLEILRQHLDKFSKKYRTLQIILETTPYYEVKPVILLKDEHDFYNVFSVASRIAGSIESVTVKINGKYSNIAPHAFESNFDKLKPYMRRGSIYFNLLSAARIPRSLHLRYNEKHDMIELVLDNLDFTSNDPEFNLCAYYGLSFGYDENIVLEDIESFFIGPVSSTDQVFRGYVGATGGRPY